MNFSHLAVLQQVAMSPGMTRFGLRTLVNEWIVNEGVPHDLALPFTNYWAGKVTCKLHELGLVDDVLDDALRHTFFITPRGHETLVTVGSEWREWPLMLEA